MSAERTWLVAQLVGLACGYATKWCPYDRGTGREGEKASPKKAGHLGKVDVSFMVEYDWASTTRQPETFCSLLSRL